MVDVRVVRVFADRAGAHGNLLGIVADGTQVPQDDRLRFAEKVGYSATVFIDDVQCGAIRIYTPAVELAFAGHPLVGIAWAMDRESMVLRPPGGDVPAWREGEMYWVNAALAASPPWWHER